MAAIINKIGYALGAEIVGFDPSKFTDADAQFVLAAFREHPVLVIRDVDMDRAQFSRFSKIFGPLDDMRVASHTDAQAKADAEARDIDPAFPEILLNTNRPRKGWMRGLGKYAEIWHPDREHTTFPGVATLLLAKTIPAVGGDTLFANMTMAYDALSDAYKEMLSPLHGVHTGGERATVDETDPTNLEERRYANLPVAHPIVRIHPETGRKSIFISEKCKDIHGMTQQESQPLIRFLIEHATSPGFVYRHIWKPKDLLIWDNRCLLHKAVGNFDPAEPRIMERICTLGTEEHGFRVTSNG